MAIKRITLSRRSYSSNCHFTSYDRVSRPLYNITPPSLDPQLEITSVKDLVQLTEPESLVLVTPALLGGVTYYLILRRFSSPMTLPLLLTMFVAIFFVILAATGTSLEARETMPIKAPKNKQ